MAAHQAPVLGILQARILEWVAISFSSAWKWEVKVKSFSCVQCFATPWPVAYQAPPSMGVPRQEYWSGVPLPSPQGEGGRSYSKWVWAKEAGPPFTWEWVQWSQEPDPAVPLEAKGWGGRGSCVVSVGTPSSLLSAGLAPSTPATLWASPNLQSLSPTPTPGTWSEVGPLKTPLAKNEWGLEATSATRLYPYSEYPLCICKPSKTWTAVLSSGRAQRETCIEQSYSSSGRSGWEIHTCFQASGYQWPYNPVRGGGLQGLSFPAELEKNEKLFRKRWVGTEV